MKKIRPAEWLWVLAEFLIRAAFVFKLDPARFYQIDEGGFAADARRLVQNGTFGPHALAPLAPAFFAGFFRLLGPSLLYPRLGEAALGALLVLIIGRMTEELSGSRRAGLFALAVSCVYPFFVYYSGLLLSETIYTLIVTTGLWLFARNLEPGRFSPALWAAGTFLLGLSALARPEAEFIIPCLFVLTLFFIRSGRLSRKAWAAGILCWIFPIAIWCVRNKLEAGTFKLDDHGGITLIEGTMFLTLNEIDTGVAVAALKKMPFYQQAQSLPEPEQDRAYFRQALGFMAGHPVQTLGQWGYKFVSFWRFYPRPGKRYIDTATSEPNMGLGHAALIAVSLFTEPWLILGGLWGLLLLLRKRTEISVLLVFILATMGIHMVSVSQMRYRLPVMPEMILGFCALADWLLEKRKNA